MAVILNALWALKIVPANTGKGATDTGLAHAPERGGTMAPGG